MIKDYLLTSTRLVKYSIFTFCLFIGVAINGAIPFLLLPTLGQALWTTGFSLSFLNNSLFSIYATNFGQPEPAAIAFGLIGAWTSGLFIWIGLHPADAYSAMTLLWLTVAFFSAFKISQLFNIDFYSSVFAALVWLSMPVIWGHAGYSMVSLGIALLPFYYLSAIKLFLPSSQMNKNNIGISFLYMSAALIAMFMDGYTFMMFAVGASFLLGVIFINDKGRRAYLIRVAFPVHIFSFLIAYLLFVIYIGKPQFEAAPIDFFRGWGIDLSYFFIPTKGVSWLADILGFSISRSAANWFGDASVWSTSFLLPLLVAFLFSLKEAFKVHKSLAYGVLTIALFSMYMSLGPSLKINSVKPSQEDVGALMPAEYALAPTGSQYISEVLPGFKNMRASYRWIALTIFCFWVFILIAGSKGGARMRTLQLIFLSIILLTNLPNIANKWSIYKNNRDSVFKIDNELTAVLGEYVQEGERVAFLPWRNDFLVNYLSSSLNIRSYNVGGDKNLDEARSHWPLLMQQFQMNKIDQNFAPRVALLLAEQSTDVVVLPYIDLLWSAHSWPPSIEFHDELRKVEEELKEYDWLEIKKSKYFSIIRPRISDLNLMQQVKNLKQNNCILLSQCIEFDSFDSENSFTQVGKHIDGSIQTTGRKGFLIYGPYQTLLPGEYQLDLNGVIGKNGEGIWLDIVSDQGKTQHAKFELQSNIKNNLLSEKFVFEKQVSNVEVRVFVEETSEIIIDSYQLKLISN